ncbi:MAG TPA: carbon-nitrogen hydrolase family protein [Pirellulaceae bacterium]|nr:carbon-nitrogen hydrolase family protein [Pirellulaceae bacterium]
MRIAGVQMDVAIENVNRNLGVMIDRLRETTGAGARLTVFPECALCGYCFGSLEEARPFAQTIPGPATEAMREACAELGCYSIFGMLELDGPKIFNAAVLVGPTGVIGSYRKVHLPYLGIDMFTSYGDRPFAVHNAGELKVGMTICYDAAFPEASRALAILGADLIALPTNWPPGAECTAASVINARAMENAVYYMAVNRVGSERGFNFIGRSKIVDPSGKTLAESQGLGDEILYAEIDPAKSRRKHVIRVPGKHEIDRLADRRPEMYGLLTQPHSLKSPGRQ